MRSLLDKPELRIPTLRTPLRVGHPPESQNPCLSHTRQGRGTSAPCVLHFPAVNPQREEESSVQRQPLLSAIVSDVHFWIPLVILMAGLLLLHELR